MQEYASSPGRTRGRRDGERESTLRAGGGGIFHSLAAPNACEPNVNIVM